MDPSWVVEVQLPLPTTLLDGFLHQLPTEPGQTNTILLGNGGKKTEVLGR